VRAGTPVQQQVEVSNDDLGFEFMLNALRLNRGFPISLFAERTGIPIAAIEEQLAQAESKGLLRRNNYKIWPTDLGKRFLNDLQQMFLRD